MSELASGIGLVNGIHAGSCGDRGVWGGVKKGLRRKEVLAWLGLERSDCLSYAWADSVNGTGAALGTGGGRGRVLIA